jgi:hypothetical protein
MFSSNTSQVADGAANYIEDVFSTWLYTGVGGGGSSISVPNGIDLTGKGGLVWIKQRNAAGNHYLYDTVRGGNKYISSNTTSAQTTFNAVTFGSSGFTDGFGWDSSQTVASWTFREQPKFFDVVTYTGDGGARNIAHNLGSVPGCIIIKRTDASADWVMYHRSTGNTQGLYLNTTDAAITSSTFWENTTPTSTTFRVGVASRVNAAGGTYVAYLFAHNAGGFGLTGTDNVISCGSYTGNGSTTGPTVTLGYEPQWVLLKNATTGTTEWVLLDNMRGMDVTGNSQYLRPNSSGAEGGFENFLAPTATGFQVNSNDSWINSSGNTYIYIAIRRGPMKVPTDGTKVYTGIARSGTGSAATVTGANFPPDLVIGKGSNSGATTSAAFTDKLRGTKIELYSTSTSAEVASGASLGAVNAFTMDGFNLDADTGGGYYNWSAGTYINWCLRRAPGFFDEVCYTGTGSARTVAHNLAAVPELMIVKTRSTSANWAVYAATAGNTNYGILNSSNTFTTGSTFWNNTTPTASVFTVGDNVSTNSSGVTYVAYLAATVPNVSKVGSYTGTGVTRTINCGFTTGARFVLIKRTDSTGNWFVYDSARGITSGNDPYLLLNSSNAEVTNTNYVDTDSTGFQVVGSVLNASGGTYVFWAIA